MKVEQMNEEQLRKVVFRQSDEIKNLKETIYKIQLTGEIPTIDRLTKIKKSFKNFVKNNVDVNDLHYQQLDSKIKELEKTKRKMSKIIEANQLDKGHISIHKTSRNYVRIAMFLNVQELLDDITSCKDEFYILPNGYKVKPTSLRYQTFVSNLSCVKCGLKGSFLALERCLNDFGGNEGTKEGSGYHLNLYSLNENGEEILMTKDHIMPK